MNRTKKKRSKRSTKPPAEPMLTLGRQRWPLERDVLFRPDRLKYVRKIIKTEGCVFCEARENGVQFESLCAFKTSYSMIILNKYPYNSGHLLVLPQRHVSNLSLLSEDEYLDWSWCVRIAAEALDRIYSPGGVNIGLNMGAAAGAGIPEHIHYHVIPRWFGDLNFFPLVAETKTVIETLETTFNRLIKYFEEQNLVSPGLNK